MKKIILLFAILFFTVNAEATQNLFYCPDKNLTITDVSGKKTLKQIEEEFDLYEKDLQGEYILDINGEKIPLKVQSLIGINERFEAGKIKNSKLVKYNYKAENAQITADKKAARETKKLPVRNKLKGLGFTDEEIKIMFE